MRILSHLTTYIIDKNLEIIRSIMRSEVKCTKFCIQVLRPMCLRKIYTGHDFGFKNYFQKDKII